MKVRYKFEDRNYLLKEGDWDKFKKEICASCKNCFRALTNEQDSCLQLTDKRRYLNTITIVCHNYRQRENKIFRQMLEKKI